MSRLFILLNYFFSSNSFLFYAMWCFYSKLYRLFSIGIFFYGMVVSFRAKGAEGLWRFWGQIQNSLQRINRKSSKIWHFHELMEHEKSIKKNLNNKATEGVIMRKKSTGSLIPVHSVSHDVVKVIRSHKSIIIQIGLNKHFFYFFICQVLSQILSYFL